MTEGYPSDNARVGDRCRLYTPGYAAEFVADVLYEAGSLLDASNAHDIARGEFVASDGRTYQV